MTRQGFLTKYGVFIIGLGIAFGPSCGATGGGGCAACPGSSDYRFAGQPIAEAIKVRVTQTGIDFITSHIEALLRSQLGADANGRITMDLPEQSFSVFNVSFAGFNIALNLTLKDGQVKFKIGSLAVGLADNPARLTVRANNVDLAFTGRLVGKFHICFLSACSNPDFSCNLKNGIDVGGPNERMLTANLSMAINLTIDAQGNFQPSVNVSSVDIVEPPGLGVRISQSSGSSECNSRTTPESLLGVNACAICDLAEFATRTFSALHTFLDNLVDSAMRGPIESAINSALAPLRGRPLKMEGRTSLAAAIAGFFPASAEATPLGFLVGPGPAGFQVTGTPKGLDLKMKGGLEATLPNPVPVGMTVPHPCVAPIVPVPTFVNGTPPTLTGVDSQGRNYHIGALIGKALLNMGGHAAYNSGALCVSLSSEDVANLSGNAFSLNTGVLSLMLPGLRELAGPGAPVILKLEPTTPPKFELGTGTGTGATRDSLITVTLQQIGISIYALIGERYARLVQVSSDFTVGISIFPQPNESLMVTIDKVNLSKIVQKYNELLPNAHVEDLLQVLFALATQTLFANQISIPVQLGALVDQTLSPACPASLRCPDSSACTAGARCPGPGIGMFINEIGRAGAQYDFLQMSLTLTDRSQNPMADAVTTTAELVEPPMERDSRGAWRATGQAVLDVGSLEQAGGARGLEFQVSIDGLAWGPFQDGPRIVVVSPLLKVIGEHRIVVRGRKKGDYRTLDPGSVEARVTVDPIAPVLKLRTVANELLFDAADELTARDAIEFSVRVDRGGWGAWRPMRGIPLGELAAGDRVVEVRARDAAGNESATSTTLLKGTGSATILAATDSADAPAETTGGTRGVVGSACSAAPTATSGGVIALLIVGAALLLRRPRGRWAGDALTPGRVAVAARVRQTSRLLMLALAFTAAAASIACDDTPAAGRRCATSSECNSGEACAPTGTCRIIPRCQTVNDCCPGQSCNSGVCETPVEACSAARACSRVGHVCKPAAVSTADLDAGPTGACGYADCASNVDCSGGASCFNGYCRLPTPCGGACQAGEVCIAAIDTCRAAPTSCASQTCEPGFVLVMTNGHIAWGPSCNLNQPCVCAELPSLAGGDIGRYASISVHLARPLVSAYDNTFGDLVLARYDETGARVSVEYVDGIPAGSPVRAGPSGVRGGVLDPGADVGKYTSLVVTQTGAPRIAYYDVDNKSLKFAAKVGEAWQTHTVETANAVGASGDVGMFTSIALDDAEKPIVAYFQKAGGADGLETAVRLARAKVATPTTAADWDIEALDTATIAPAAPPPCGGCATGQSCVQDGAAQRCAAPTNDCTPDCGSSKACISGRCLSKVNPRIVLEDIPQGVGLFTSVAERQGVVYIAYYDRTRGNLKGAVRRADGTKIIAVVDGEKNGRDTGDVGAFTSLALDLRGEIGIAYYDQKKHELKYYAGPDFTTGVTEVVDTGLVVPGQKDFVGANATLGYNTLRQPVIAYHDATDNDLRFAKRISGSIGQGSWSIDTVRSQGAHGFFTDMRVDGVTAYIVSLQMSFTPLNMSDNTLWISLRPAD